MAKRKVKKVAKKGRKARAKKIKVLELSPHFRFELPEALVEATAKLKKLLRQPIHLNKYF